MSETSTTIYSFDSSALINSWRRYYPPAVFPTLWDGLAEMMVAGRIVMCKEAEKEIMTGKDELSLWLKPKDACVKEYTREQIETVAQIVNKYPKVSQYNKTRPQHADPFVVALAKAERAIVVTWEGPNASLDNPAIPDLCKEYGVKCYDLIQFFGKEGWSFKH